MHAGTLNSNLNNINGSLNNVNSNLIINSSTDLPLKSKYVKWSCYVTAGVLFQGTLNFASLGIDPTKVVDCFITPNSTSPNKVFASIYHDKVYVVTEVFTGALAYGLWILYTA